MRKIENFGDLAKLECDPDLFWKSNGFEKVKKISGGEYWLLSTLYDTNNRWGIAYYPQLDELEVTSTINGDEYHYYGKCIGIYDFIKAVEVCNINKSWRL